MANPNCQIVIDGLCGGHVAIPVWPDMKCDGKVWNRDALVLTKICTIFL